MPDGAVVAAKVYCIIATTINLMNGGETESVPISVFVGFGGNSGSAVQSARSRLMTGAWLCLSRH